MTLVERAAEAIVGPSLAAVVLSDGDDGAALRSALHARTWADEVRLVERRHDHAVAAVPLVRAAAGVELLHADWMDDRDTGAVAGLRARWVVVLAAGEQLEGDPRAALLAVTDAGPATSGLGLSRPDGFAEIRVQRRAALDPSAFGEPVASTVPGVRLVAAPAPVVTCCPLCGVEGAGFAPLPQVHRHDGGATGFEHPDDGWELLALDTYACTHCGASDRDRLIALYVEAGLAARPHPSRFVDFAPSYYTGSVWQARLGPAYRSADLFKPGVDDTVDLQDMVCYPDGSVDWFVCSHVLEHVPDDHRAMQEIRRVLAPDGTAVLLVPISLVRDEVEEDPGETDPARRLARFGQDDHVRLYTRDGFVSRLQAAGLAVERVGVDRFGPDAAARYGIPPGGALYIATRS